MSEARFYIELPEEKGGCVALPYAVVEAEYHPAGGPDLHPFTNPARPVLIISAPAEVSGRWPGWYADAFGGWAETEGPARMLDDAEYRALIATITERGVA